MIDVFSDYLNKLDTKPENYMVVLRVFHDQYRTIIYPVYFDNFDDALSFINRYQKGIILKKIYLSRGMYEWKEIYYYSEGRILS